MSAVECAGRRAEFAAKALDFVGFLAVLERHALSSLGLNGLRELAPREEGDARAALARTREMIERYEARDAPSFAGVSDLTPAVERARREGRSFETEELVAARAFFAACERLVDWLDRVRGEAPALAQLGIGCPDLADLRDAIDHVVDTRGRIKDDASSRLVDLRREERRLGENIDRELRALLKRGEIKSVLSDAAVHLRAGRRVLAVRAKSSGRVPGLVHDRSQSEQTVFVEPREILELGNRQAEVRSAIRAEIGRLLLELTRAVLDREGEVRAASECMRELELAAIGAAYAAATGGRVALLPGEEDAAESLRLRTARHPLLLEEERLGNLSNVVPIDVRLGEHFDMLVITGPNTGGKTLALKTCGLLALMTRCGLPVPAARGTTIPIYDGIVADIGDEQEISQSLSTFSSHMVRIRDGLARATPRTLVLLDELGGGTDPDEGAALGEAILEGLLERAVPTIASTHLGKLKELAFRYSRAENACVEFDAQSLSPLYRLLVGTPGESGALVIAERLGLPKEICQLAYERLERRDEELVELMAEVRVARTEAERVRSEAEVGLDDVSARQAELAQQQKELDRRGELLEAEAQRGIEERVREARRSLERAQALLAQLPAASRAEMDVALRVVERDLGGASLTERRAEFLESLAKGKLVYLPRYRQRCIIHKVDRERREVTVKLGSMKVKVAFDEVTWYEAL